MILREQLAADLKDAMRQQDEARKRTIRLIIAALAKAETELDSHGARISLNDDDILALISKQVKQRQESIAAYGAGGRQDLVAEEEAELAILQSYLPRQVSHDEITAEARRVIAEVGASGPHDIGKVMKPVLARLKGKADSQLVAQIVRDLLAG